MKAKIITTNEYGEFIERDVFSSTPLSGISTATACSETENKGFVGCGVAITGASCYNLALMNKEDRQKLLKHLYTSEGLNMKIGRLTIGSSDYSAELYSYDDVEGDVELKHFSIDRDKDYIIPMIKEILEIKPDLKLFASPWSPPGWMKTGGSIGGGYMREKYLDVYAEYFVKYVKAYEAEGIKISAVTIQNEPETHQNGQMPACRWHPDTEAKFAGILRKAFDKNNIDAEIWFFDHNFVYTPRVKWCFEEYPSLKNDCAGIAFHYYGGNVEQTAKLKKLLPDVALHFTEGGPRLYDNYATDWCKWGLMVIRALNNGYSSFTGWNLMLDETGGPNIGPFFCGGLVTRNNSDNTLSYSGQYKVFKHFASLTKDSVISPLSFERSELPLFAYPKQERYAEGCVATDKDGNQTLFLVNPNDKKEQVQYFYKGNWWYIELMPNTLATVFL